MANLNKTTCFALLLGACAYWISFRYLDQSIAYSFANFPHSNYWYIFFQLITFLGDPKVGIALMVVSFIAACGILSKQPQSKVGNHLLFMAIAMIVAIGLESSLKYLLGRYRPELLFQQGLYGFHFLSHQFSMNSSPSGHATRAFVLTTSISLLWKKMTYPLFLIGLLVCASRLILEMHYLSDVIFGSLLGIFTTLWVAKIYYSVTISQTLDYVNSSR